MTGKPLQAVGEGENEVTGEAVRTAVDNAVSRYIPVDITVLFEKIKGLQAYNAILLFKELLFQRGIHDGLVLANTAGKARVDGLIKIVFQYQRFGDVEIDITAEGPGIAG